MTTVSVTAEHIAKGFPGDCGDCPVWHAITAAIPGLAYLRVRYLDIDVRPRPEDDLVIIEIPDGVARFIRAFDVGRPVEPFTFELDYPAVTP
jgi:hypothetical protein